MPPGRSTAGLVRGDAPPERGTFLHDHAAVYGNHLPRNVPGLSRSEELHDDGYVLDGTKFVYRNGIKVAEIPYVNGHKHGMETHWDDLSNLTAEIEWKHDKKHGSSKLHSEEDTEEEWFYKGEAVSRRAYDLLLSREQMVAELTTD